MSADCECPYCGKEIDICHDDGYGYEEDVLHEQYCGACDKYFTYTTSISFYYETYKADCLNGSEHKFKPTKTFPIEFTEMKCEDCEERRKPTEEEWIQIRQPLV